MVPLSLEERVAYLEGKVDEHSRGFDDLRASIGRVDAHVLALDSKVDRFRDELGSRIEDLRMDHGSRIDGLGSRVGSLDQKIDRFRDELDRKMSWLVGIQVAVLLAVLGSLIR